MPHEDRGRDRSKVAASQRTPETIRRVKMQDCPLESSEKAEPFQHLDFRLLASRTIREYASVQFVSMASESSHGK